MDRNLITGAGGFIGGHLRRDGERVLIRRSIGARDEAIADLLAPNTLGRACQGIDTVFHCAGFAHVRAPDPEVHWRVNFQGTKNLVEAAGSAGVRRFVFLSSVKAMADPGEECVNEAWPGKPATAYGCAKRAAEETVLSTGQKYGMHVVNLRLAMVYGSGGRGNFERMARGIRAGWFPRLPETGNRRSLVYVQDVVEVMRVVAQHPKADGNTYIVADPQPYSGREIYDTIRGVGGGARVPGYMVPTWVLRAAGSLHPKCAEVVDRLIGSACYSPAKIERELGWRAKCSLVDGVSKMLEQK